MCEAFSCIVGIDGKVYWKAGFDSHEEIRDRFKIADKENYTPIEITPEDGYLKPDCNWSLKFDDKCPDWWKKSHEKHAYEALASWKKEVYAKINLKEARQPINPLLLPMVKKVTNKHIVLLKEWDSVWGTSLRASVGRDSVRDSVWAYFGSLFYLKRSEWRYTEKIKIKGYPFRSAVLLWKEGLVASFDGKLWRLHSGEKAKVVFQISKEELREYNPKRQRKD